jgi:uncharacterized membrane protein
MAKSTGPPTALDDAGAVQAFLFMGWLPPAAAAAVGGLIAAFATGSVLTFFGVVLGGTMAGYVTGLVLLFTVGNALSGRVGERVADAFLISVVVVSVVAALAVAVSASSFEFDPALVDSVTRAMTTVLGLVVIVLMAIGLIAARRRRR